MALSDMKVFNEYLKKTTIETLGQQIEKFNGASAGSIRLTRSAVVQAIAPMQMPACKDRVRSGAGFTYPEEQEELSAARRRAIRFPFRQ